MRWGAKTPICFWWNCVVFVSTFWKNVGMTLSLSLLFCSLIQGIVPKIRMLCFVLINSIRLPSKQCQEHIKKKKKKKKKIKTKIRVVYIELCVKRHTYVGLINCRACAHSSSWGFCVVVLSIFMQQKYFFLLFFIFLFFYFYFEIEFPKEQSR